jgi:hypothetical protein
MNIKMSAVFYQKYFSGYQFLPGFWCGKSSGSVVNLSSGNSSEFSSLLFTWVSSVFILEFSGRSSRFSDYSELSGLV